MRLALLGGALLIGLHQLAKYSLFMMIRLDTSTAAIIDQFESTYNGPAANMPAVVQLIRCLDMLRLDTALHETALLIHRRRHNI